MLISSRPSARSARGILLILSATLLWGTTGTAQSFSADALSPYWVGALRLLVATGFFVLYAAALLGPRRLARELAATQWRHALLAGCCMAGYNLAFFAGVKATGVAVGTALALGSGPIWAGLLQIASGHAPARAWWLGTGLAVGGGVLLVFGRGGAVQGDLTGIALCLAAGFAYALYATLNKHLVRQTHPGVATLAVFAVGALVAVPMAWLWVGDVQITARGWAVVGFLGVAATGVAYLLFSSGLRTVTAASAVSLALMEPVTAFLLAIVIVGERPDAMAGAGLAVLLAGLMLVIRAELRAPAS